jgi:hypothetical protein
MTHAHDGRLIFHWRGRDRAEDIAALADAVAAAVPGLANLSGTLAHLDAHGGLSPLGRNALQRLIDEAICGMRVVNRDGLWQREYFTFGFEQPPRPDPALIGRGPLPGIPATEPDLPALDELLKAELIWRVPRVKG